MYLSSQGDGEGLERSTGLQKILIFAFFSALRVGKQSAKTDEKTLPRETYTPPRREPCGEVFLPLRERFHASMLRDGPNPALQKFMERKAPRAHDAQVKMKVHIPEEQSLINYPKDISGTILMCESRFAAASPQITPDRARVRVRADADQLCPNLPHHPRKNMSMRMAVKTSADKMDKIEPPEVHGRLKSDITHGKEKIYERSYY